MTFGMKLQELRQSKEWSQKQLAEKAGTAQSQIARWEAGEKIPGFDDVLMLCQALGVRCTAFDGCEFAGTKQRRGRGRPKKKS